MGIYCMDCGKEFVEKPDSCPRCDSERIFDTEEITDFMQKKIVEEGMREDLLTLLQEKQEGLATQEEVDEAMGREIDKLLDSFEEEFSELKPGETNKEK